MFEYDWRCAKSDWRLEKPTMSLSTRQGRNLGRICTMKFRPTSQVLLAFGLKGREYLIGKKFRVLRLRTQGTLIKVIELDREMTLKLHQVL